MFDKFNMNNIMEKAQDMQKELENITVTGESGAGAVTIQMNARHTVSSVSIDDDIIKDASTNKAVLEELVMAAINNAAHKIEDKAKERMSDINSIMGTFMGKNNDDDKS